MEATAGESDCHVRHYAPLAPPGDASVDDRAAEAGAPTASFNLRRGCGLVQRKLSSMAGDARAAPRPRSACDRCSTGRSGVVDVGGSWKPDGDVQSSHRRSIGGCRAGSRGRSRPSDRSVQPQSGRSIGGRAARRRGRSGQPDRDFHAPRRSSSAAVALSVEAEAGNPTGRVSR